MKKLEGLILKAKIWTTDTSGKRLSFDGEQDMVLAEKDIVEEQGHPGDVEANIVNIHDDITYQTVGGIGGAFTHTSATVWDSMTEQTKEKFIKSYFDNNEGIGYNFVRLSIASCDYSTEYYTYVDENDETLESFNIEHDEKTVLPMVRQAKAYADLTLFASPWSPPSYMKTNNHRIGGHLKKEYYGLWAKYFRKYIEACKEKGVDIWGVTMQNEPRHHQVWESCLYTPEEEAEFLGYLGRELDGMGVKILCYDHCRERILERSKVIFESENGKYCDGTANHWYSGDHFGELRAYYTKYPNKISVASESCCAFTGKGITFDYDLDFAERYAHDLCGCFNNGLNYYCDWNMLLDENSGPSHNREKRPCSADAPVYYIKDQDKLIYKLSYFYIGHYSKFVKKDALVVASSSYNDKVETVAFKNTDGTIVCVLLNRSDNDYNPIVRHKKHILNVSLKAHSIVTVVIGD